MFSVNFVTFVFCKLLFCHDSVKNVAGIDAVVPLPAAKQKIFNSDIENLPTLRVASLFLSSPFLLFPSITFPPYPFPSLHFPYSLFPVEVCPP